MVLNRARAPSLERRVQDLKSWDLTNLASFSFQKKAEHVARQEMLLLDGVDNTD